MCVGLTWAARRSHYKYFRVTGIFILCGLVYVIGFALRILGAWGFDGNLVVFIISVCLIYMVPYANADLLSISP